MQTVQYTLPSHWAVALINGDITGYEESEIDQIDEFEQYLSEKYLSGAYCVDVEEDNWFTSQHDATEFGVLACDVSVFTFDVGE